MSENLRVDAAIVVPWRAAKGREQSFDLAWRYNNKEFADFKIYFSDSVGEKFNVSEARNRGCLQAIEDGYKVLVVMDADTIFLRENVLKAIEMVSSEYVITYLYTYAFETNERSSYLLDIGASSLEELLEGHALYEGHVGSGWAMSSDMFLDMNGWDENFHGWGYEDNAFEKAYQLLFNKKMSRAPGTCYRLWHPERDAYQLQGNTTRYTMFYDKPNNTAKRMRRAIEDNMVHLFPNALE